MEIFGYLAIAFIGIVLGSIGAGGSMLAIPVLVYMFSLDMITASAYALFLVGITSMTGAVIRTKQQEVDVRAAFAFGIPSIACTFIARKWIIGWIPNVIWQTGSFRLLKDDLLLFLFSWLMIVSAVMILKSKPEKSYNKARTFHLLPTGVFVGLVAGSIGAGGGFLILPAMTFAGLRFKTAVGTTLIIIASNSLLGFCGHLSNESVDWHFLFGLTALALSGLIVGEWTGRKMYFNHCWKKLFAWLSLATGTGTLMVLIADLFSRP